MTAKKAPHKALEKFLDRLTQYQGTLAPKPWWKETKPPTNLKKALALYGAHLGTCPMSYWNSMKRYPVGTGIIHTQPIPPYECMCGLSKLLSKI